MTLAHIEALEERRTISLRYGRFNAALVVSAMCGVSPFDLLPGFEPTGEELQRKEIKKGIATAFMRLPIDVTPEEVSALREKIIERLKAQGHEEAEDIMNEVFET